jgi:lysine decarboxylase
MADFIMLYPPGIPLLVPGEVMSEEIRRKIEDSVRMGLQVHGVTEDGRVTVLDERAVNMAL